MRCLNEHLARRANIEDNCTGRFWQGRFKSQALLDEAGLLTAMVYVDLNPIRAGIADAPEDSEYTSIYDRIKELRQGLDSSATAEVKPPLHPFRSEAGATKQAIPFSFTGYLELIDWTGRVRRDDKRGVMRAELPPIMQRLSIDPDAWFTAMQPRGNVFGRAIGRLDYMRLHASTLGQSWVRGLENAKRMYRFA